MTRRTAAFVYSDALASHVLREDHPMKPVRLRYTYELLQAYHIFDQPGCFVAEPRMATEKELLSFHTPDYIDAVKRISKGDFAVNPAKYNMSIFGDNPFTQGMYEANALVAGSAIVAAEFVASGRAEAAFAPAGGLHHAMSGYASGFCYFNDCVMAINHLMAFGKRVVYIDIDAHHGDGVQKAYWDTKKVMTISLHESGRYLFPGTGASEEVGEGEGEGTAVNVPLAPYTGDTDYVWAFMQVVPPLVKAFKPDAIVTQLGADSYYSDPLTHLRLTTNGFEACVKEFASWGLPWVALGGGGYDVTAVPRLWALAYAIMAGIELPDDIPSSWADRYGMLKLRDRPGTGATRPDLQEEVRRTAEESVAKVKELVFPVYGLRA